MLSAVLAADLAWLRRSAMGRQWVMAQYGVLGEGCDIRVIMQMSPEAKWAFGEADSVTESW